MIIPGSFVRAFVRASVSVCCLLVIACSARAETLSADVQATPPATWKREDAPRDPLGPAFGKLLAAYKAGDDCYVQIRRKPCTSKDSCAEMDFTQDGLWSDANEHAEQCCTTDQCSPSAAAAKDATYKCGTNEDVQPPTETSSRVRQRRTNGSLTVEVAEFFTTLSKGHFATLVASMTCNDAAYKKHSSDMDAFAKSIVFGPKHPKP
jgi:hypothetical protein